MALISCGVGSANLGAKEQIPAPAGCIGGINHRTVGVVFYIEAVAVRKAIHGIKGFRLDGVRQMLPVRSR